MALSEIETKYGVIEVRHVDDYLTRLIGRIFKILPMNEERCPTIELYTDSLVRELFGNSHIFLHDELLTISGTLKGLNFKNHKQVKSDIFKIINLIYKAKERVK